MLIDGFEALSLHAGRLRAAFVPSAGMVGVSLRDGDDELLGQRRGLAAYVRDAKTMGIPFLHPWANRLAGDEYRVGDVDVRVPAGVRRDPNGLPIHGLLAGSPLWEVESAEPARLVATLDFGARPELLAAFPFPHRLRIELALGEHALRVVTTLTATGERPVPLAFGFHPYLRLPGVPRADWQVELPGLRRLELDARGIPTGASTPAPASRASLGTRALDDAYAGVEPGATFAVAGGERRLAVRFEAGYPAAQVFAPLSEDVICFEPMAAPTNALVSGESLRLVAPGERASTAFSIVVGGG